MSNWIDEYDKSMDTLADEFIMKKGVIVLVYKEHEITKEEYEAIDYLCSEWDYTYKADK